MNIRKKILGTNKKQLELDKLNSEIAKSTERFSKLNQELSKKDNLTKEDLYQITSCIIESGKLRAKKINLRNPKNELFEHYNLDQLDTLCRENFAEIIKMTKLKKYLINDFFVSIQPAGNLYNRLLTTAEIAYYPSTENNEQDELYAKTIAILYEIYQNKQVNLEYRYQDTEELHNLLMKYDYLEDSILCSKEEKACLQEIINSIRGKDLSTNKVKQKTK